MSFAASKPAALFCYPTVSHTSLFYLPCQLADTQNSDLALYFEQAIRFIDEAHAAGGAVLVHCMAGISRSTTIVLAYLIDRHQKPFAEAIECAFCCFTLILHHI